MSRRVAMLALVAAVVAAVVAVGARAAVGDRVVGSGTKCSVGTCDFVETFSFSATATGAGGSAVGSFAFSSTPDAGGTAIDVVSGRIVCATFLAGRVALKGVLDNVVNSRFAVGDEITWWVQDTAGPSGPPAVGDAISDQTVGRGLPCGDFSEFRVAPLRNGDIQIVPGARYNGATQKLPDGGIALYDDNGIAHRLNAGTELTSQLVALAGLRLNVYGTPLRSDISNTPIRVDDFRVESGGALNGEQVTVSGPLRRLADGAVIVDDDLGHGHRLTGVPDWVLAPFVGRRATVGGVAVVTNAASRINWPVVVAAVIPG